MGQTLEKGQSGLEDPANGFNGYLKKKIPGFISWSAKPASAGHIDWPLPLLRHGGGSSAANLNLAGS